MPQLSVSLWGDCYKFIFFYYKSQLCDPRHEYILTPEYGIILCLFFVKPNHAIQCKNVKRGFYKRYILERDICI